MSGVPTALTEAEVFALREAVDADECCECHEYNDTSHLFAAVERILAARSPTATGDTAGDDLRDRVAALAEMGVREQWPPDEWRAALLNHVSSSAPVVSRPEATVKRDEFSAERRHDILEALSWMEGESGRWGYDRAADVLHAHEVEWCGRLDGRDAYESSFAADPETP